VKAYLVLLVGVVSVSFAAIFIRLADAPPLVIAAYRLTIASLILIPLAYKKTIPSMKRLSGRDGVLLLLSSFFLALHFALWITSLSYTSIASSVILVTCHPAFVAVISYFLWHEVLNRLTIGGMAIAFAGIVLINYGGFAFGPQAVLGDVLALIAGFAMGGYLIIGGQLRNRIEILPYLTVIYTGAAVILLLATAGFGHGGAVDTGTLCLGGYSRRAGRGDFAGLLPSGRGTHGQRNYRGYPYSGRNICRPQANPTVSGDKVKQI